MNINERETIWSQKYRPNKISDILMSPEKRKFFQGMVDESKLVNMILVSSPGTGKTAIAKALVNEFGSEYMFLNGSGEDRGISTVKTKIIQFASTKSLFGSGVKVVIFDEACSLTRDAQMALKAVIEEFSANCVFILTANYGDKIDSALKSRCKPIDMNPEVSSRIYLIKEMIKRSAFILKNEGVKFEVNALKDIVVAKYPDFRSVLADLQYLSTGGNPIDAVAVEKSKASDVKFMLENLAKKNFKEVVGWVYENVTDSMEIYQLFRNMKPGYIKPSSAPQVVLLLDEYMIKDGQSPDRLLSLAAFLTKIMMECEFD